MFGSAFASKLPVSPKKCLYVCNVTNRRNHYNAHFSIILMSICIEWISRSHDFHIPSVTRMILLLDYVIVTHHSCLLQPHIIIHQFVVLFFPSGSRWTDIISKVILHHSTHEMGQADRLHMSSSTCEPAKPIDYQSLDSIDGDYA